MTITRHRGAVRRRAGVVQAQAAPVARPRLLGDRTPPVVVSAARLPGLRVADLAATIHRLEVASDAFICESRRGLSDHPIVVIGDICFVLARPEGRSFET